jgi:hypothetical protein
MELVVPSRNLSALRAALALYLVMSPLSLYNTAAMFGLVESRYVPVQLAMTAVMIYFAIVASKSIGHHCHTTEPPSLARTLWMVSFYIIGPPALYAYYKLRA